MQAEFQLLQSQKNQVFDLVRRMGFDPARFEWAIGPRGRFVKSIRLRPIDSPYFFDFQSETTTMGLRRVSQYSPGMDEMVGRQEPYTWDEQLSHVRYWLTYLKRELAAPDLWQLAQRELELFRHPWEAEDNSPFSADEQQEIAATLRAVAERVGEIEGLSDDQKEATRKVLQHLEDASKREGRRDWFFMLGGVILGWAANVGISPDMVHQFAAQIVSGIRGLL